MAISKEKKEEILKELKNILKSSGSVVFTKFHGLNVSETGSMRKSLKDSNVNYLVAKKTLVKKALADEGLEGEIPELEGELSLAYGEDILEPSRNIFGFQKKFDEKISILGGIFDGKLIGKEKMIEIAQIPSRQTLYAQFVNIINSPIQGFAVAIKAIADKKA